MVGEKGFFGSLKNESQLDKQLQDAQEQIGNKQELNLIPSDISREQIMRMPVTELRTRFARRYEMYLDLLRSNKRGDFVSRDELIGKIRKWLIALNSLDQYIQQHQKGRDVVLRGRQIDVFRALRDFLETGGESGYVKLPTGYGKTVLFVELIEALDLKTLVVVPTNILVDQTGDKMNRFAPDLDVGRIDQVAKEYHRTVTVTTYASLLKQIANGHINPHAFECLILDESHEATSDARTAAIQRFDNAVKIGFSATPRVTKMLLTEIYAIPLRDAIEEGGLSSVSVVIARTKVDISKVNINDNGEFSEKELEAAVNIASRNQAAAELYKQAFNGQLGIAYCVGIEHAHAVAAEFRARGIPAEAISGETNKKEQERLLNAFHEGRIKVLCNADLLIQGFDEPRASVCLNLRPTRSRIYAEQRGGRVLRLDEDNLVKHATVVEFLDDTGESIKNQVLFTGILNAAYVGLVERGSGSWGKAGAEGVKPQTLIVAIPDLDVVFNADEVMRIERIMSERSKKIEQIKDLDRLKAEVQAAGVTTAADYKEQCKLHPGWPYEPSRLLGWKGWFDFLGKKSIPLIRDLDILKTEVLAAGVTKTYDYKKQCKYHPGWPNNPGKLFGWKDWFDFFGKEKSPEVEQIKDLDTLKAEVQAAGVTGVRDYKERCKHHSSWPSEPNTLLGWKDWFNFLGKEKPVGVELIKDLETLKAAVRTAGVTDSSHYQKQRKLHTKWPSKPERLPGWKDWFDFLGKR